MALKLVGTSQNSTSHELDPSTSPWVTWSLPAVPWIAREKDIGVILTPGKYRVEPIGGIVRYWSADGSTSTDITGPAVLGEGTLRAYSDRGPATHVVITRLAHTPVGVFLCTSPGVNPVGASLAPRQRAGVSGGWGASTHQQASTGSNCQTARPPNYDPHSKASPWRRPP